MITSKVTKSTPSNQTTEEKLFKLLESIDWKLWEMYNMMKKEVDAKSTSKKTTTKSSTKKTEA